MRAATRQRIQAARVQAERQESKANTHEVARMHSPVSPVIVDEMLTQPKWWTFSEIKERFGVSYDTVSRSFRGRDGVAKFGSDYRVSEAALRHWLSGALTEARNSLRLFRPE
jgi:hypothetical protein